MVKFNGSCAKAACVTTNRDEHLAAGSRGKAEEEACGSKSGISGQAFI